MYLRSRLARLDSVQNVAPVSSPPAPNLEALRKRIDAMVSRSVPVGRFAPDAVSTEPDATPTTQPEAEIPFAVEHTHTGPLHVLSTYLHGHRVGREAVVAARGACSELLAYLALNPALAGCDPTAALYLDTETTGLGPSAGNVAFLVGLAFFESCALRVEQLFLPDFGQERPMLERVKARIESASMLVTFNGKSFDLPLLRSRFVMAGIAPPREPPHLDLLHVARRVHKARKMSATLQTVERTVLGFVREGDVPSDEVSACYFHYLRTRDAQGIVRVVEHNAWDVASMVALVGLYGEPLESTRLHATDLVGVARTLKRAGRTEHAYAIADEACKRGAGDDGLRARGDIAKARGDRDRALADFEAAGQTVHDPRLRLELSKLYEHHVKDHARALSWATAGTGESEERVARRLSRLRSKLDSLSKRRLVPAPTEKPNRLW